MFLNILVEIVYKIYLLLIIFILVINWPYLDWKIMEHDFFSR